MPSREDVHSLGVTAILDELHFSDDEGEAPAREAPSSRSDEAALRRTFCRSEKLCDEVRAYFDLLAQEEAERETDARREAADKMSRAERRLQETDMSLFEALDANEARLAEMRADLLAELERVETMGATARSFNGGATGADPVAAFAATAGSLDLERLLKDCDAMREETAGWQRLRDGPEGKKRLASFEAELFR
eukprot:TRINITY_DN38627_c0_g1_i1.p2 TRINITY_DN38627_c0_g1~~TRINITY_DN38627_c0_g1_i1.p2  ORF type:complete len:211 (+),score=69.34 TRINITY_DN38627_c0_g1_i1:52-633(+)